MCLEQNEHLAVHSSALPVHPYSKVNLGRIQMAQREHRGGFKHPFPKAILADRKCQSERSKFSTRDYPIQQDPTFRKMALDDNRLIYSTHSLSTELFRSEDEITVVVQAV